MKKVISLVMVVVMVLMFSACGSVINTSRKDAADFDEITHDAKVSSVSEIKKKNESVGNAVNAEVMTPFENVPEAFRGNFSIENIPGFKESYFKVIATPDVKGLTQFNSDIKMYLGNLLVLGDPSDIASIGVINLNRNKITLIPDNEATTSGNFKTLTVDNTASAVAKGVNEIFKDFYGNNTKLNLQYTIASSQVTSSADIAQFLGIAGEDADDQLKGMNNFAKINEDEVTVVVAIKQNYGSVRIELPWSTGDFFANDVTAKDYKKELQMKAESGDMAAPLIVSRASYGRIAMMKITADITKISGNELENAITKSINISQDNVSLEDSQLKAFNQLMERVGGKTEYFILGGTAEGNADILEYVSIMDMFREIKNYDKVTSESLAAFPIDFTLVHLDGTNFSNVPCSVRYEKRYTKIPVNTIAYDGAANVKMVNGTYACDLTLGSVLNLDKSEFAVVAPADAILTELDYVINAGQGKISNGVLTPLSTAKVGDKIVVSVHCKNNNAANSNVIVFEVTIK